MPVASMLDRHKGSLKHEHRMQKVTRRPFAGSTPRRHAPSNKPQDDNAPERQSPTQNLCSTVKFLLDLVLRPSIGLSSNDLNCDGCPLRVTGLARKAPATRLRDEACFAQNHPQASRRLVDLPYRPV